jgi:hypothetical protein
MELERHREESKIDLENQKKLAKIKPKTDKKK